MIVIFKMYKKIYTFQHFFLINCNIFFYQIAKAQWDCFLNFVNYTFYNTSKTNHFKVTFCLFCVNTINMFLNKILYYRDYRTVKCDTDIRYHLCKLTLKCTFKTFINELLDFHIYLFFNLFIQYPLKIVCLTFIVVRRMLYKVTA